MNKKSVADIAIQACLVGNAAIAAVVDDRVWQGSAAFSSRELYLVWLPQETANEDNMTSEIRHYSIEVHVWGESDQDVETNDLQELVKVALETELATHLDGGGYYVVGVTQSSLSTGPFGKQFQSIGTYEIRVGKR